MNGPRRRYDSPGVRRPFFAEVWSLRAHRLGQWATYRRAAGFAAAAVIAFAGATGMVLVNAIMFPAGGLVRLLLAVFIGPLAVAISAVVLLHRTGRLSAPAAASTAAATLVACGFAALAAGSWSVGFDEADAGLGRSWFGSSTLLFLLLAWVAGTVALLAPVGSALGKPRSVLGGVVQRTVLAAPLAVLLGAMTLLAPLAGALGAVGLLIVTLRLDGAEHPAAFPDRAPLPSPARPSPARPAERTRRRDAAARTAALVTMIVGLGCAVFALTGSSWAPMVTDATHAMNLGLAAGALAAVPATIAAGVVLTPRFGRVMRWSALLCCASLFVTAAAQLLGAGHPAQWPLVLLAAVLMGFAVAAPFGQFIPGGPSVRFGVATLLGLAASLIGLPLVTMAGFVAPCAAVALFVWLSKRLAGPGQLPPPRPVKPQHG